MPVRAPDDVWQAPGTFRKSLNKSADDRPGTGRCTPGHRPMFYESNCHRWKATWFCRSTYSMYINISLLKTKNISTKQYISFEQLRIINMQQVLLKFLQSWASVVFFSITVSVSLNHSYFNNLFLWRNGGEFWYKWIHHCTWKFVINRPGTVRCPADLLQRRPGTVRHRTVPVRASADVIIYRRQPAPIRYVTTQEKNLKNRPVPGRLSDLPVMCKSLKSYDVSFICDHSIMPSIYNKVVIF